GVTGMGYSSINGYIALPVASVEALKHIADRWALELSLSWSSLWVQRSGFAAPSYPPLLGYSAGSASSLVLHGGATRQLAERVALAASASVIQTAGCLTPTCAWV